ncbi:enhancer of mRNA-decapping protein 4 isoform X2 [Neocloeon triangulifer]|uniref:enhancer of mRNA-decapping protein 4 isoform X2 n=1 Tax=Neocloeon triangulifer TaxID=2078957 RepID=UPI00286EE7C7|nr:enhancer of mRNA-decapping protein 4 isoform X2 [Neocloeon triangulifer]
MGDKEDFLGVSVSPASKEKKLMNCTQNVKFIGEAAESHELCCTDVKVVCGQGFHTSGSSKLTYKNIVDFNWESRYYTGQLIAVHCRGRYFAYGLKTVKGDAGANNGVIRVVSENSGKRALIRGLKGMVQDLAFSHIREEVILACVDPQGSLFVHSIEEGTSELKCQLVLHVEKNCSLSANIVHRVVWCPYIPDGTVDKEVAELLVLTSGQKAEMWCVPIVHASMGAGPHKPEDITEGVLRVPEFDHTITDAAFSPDGSAIAIATAGGLVSFFQVSKVYMHNKAAPRCLHSWTPHNDQPLTTLLFLDNHQEHSPEIQFWKWALTGAKDNTEIKLWACETWACLQTIKFEPGPNRGLASANKLVLKAAIDLSSKYLVLSDINSRMLYVLQMQMDNSPAHVSLVSGFNLHHPAISFAIVEAGIKARFRLLGRTDIHSSHDDDDDDEDDSSRAATCVVLKMYIVGPKSLQECQLAFEPIAEPPTISHETLDFPDEIADNSCQDTIVVGSESLSTPVNTSLVDALNASSGNNLSSGNLNLMTPEAFTSPQTRQEENPSVASTISTGSNKKLESTPIPSAPDVSAILTQLTQISQSAEEQNLNADESLIIRVRDGGMASGGSSPSREVQQILSQDKDGTGSLSDDFFEAKEEQQDITIEEINVEPKEELESDKSSYSWPQIPPIPDMPPALQDITDDVPNINDIDIPDIPVVPTVPEQAVEQNKEVLEELRSLSRCVQALTTIIEEQQVQIKDLQTQVLRTVPRKDVLENAATVALEKALSRQLSRQSQAIESQIKQKLSDMESSMSISLAKSVDVHVYTKMQKVFETEIQKMIMPSVISNMDLIKGLVQTDISQKMQAADKTLNENISRLVHNKQLQDNLSASLAASLQMSMASCFKEVLLATVVPSFEKTCKTLFSQLNEAFSRGTSEHLAAVEAQLEKQRLRHQEKTRETNSQLAALSDSVRIGHDATAAMVRTELHTALSNITLNLQESVIRATRDAVNDSVTRTLREHSSNIHSRPETPQSRIDPQAQLASILNLVQQGQLNSAFQQALSASDLQLLVKLCERVNPQQVFSMQPCPLQQPVLLSLIQQLSADLTTNTSLKVSYLEEAVVNLVPDSAGTKQYVPNIVSSLQKQLNSFITMHPNDKVVRPMKMLLLATQALVPTTKY